MQVSPPGANAHRARKPHAGELFTDRLGEAAAFKESLRQFRMRLDDTGGVDDARHNVLVFHGMGGIGKTALSERLEAWVGYRLPLDSGWGPPPATRVASTGRIDLHESAGQLDLVAALLALRAGVAGLKPRWPVFDLAFAAYWSAIRPGDPLPDYRGSTQVTQSVIETIGDVLSDVGSVADLAGSGVGGGLAVRAMKRLAEDVRRRRDLHLGSLAYDGFADFLVRCADEPSPTDARPGLACEIAGALAWELSQLSPTPLVVVFVDTTERLAADPRRVSEGHLNQLVHQLPNVLFVLSGRNMLDWWDDARLDLAHRGSGTWPHLRPGTEREPRQHLIGNLSLDDTLTVVQRGRRLLDLPMSDEVCRQLAEASGGLPQYLELARQVAISVADEGRGRQVAVGDVTGSLDSLVVRILDDIPADEQRAIRAASLFRSFDAALVAAAADVDHGCAERAINRPMIDRVGSERFPYRMHDAVREAVRVADHQIHGGWSSHDWELASSRAVACARRLHDDAKRRESTREVLDALGVAIGLVCDQPTRLEAAESASYDDWLTRAIVYAPSVQGLRSRVPSVSRTGYGQRVLDFILAKSVDVTVEERLDLLRGVFASDHPLSYPAGRHLGYLLRQQYRWDESLAVFHDLSVRRPTPLHLRQPPLTLGMARRFQAAYDAAEEAPDALTALRRRADYYHGLPERYFAEIGPKIASLRSSGRMREWLEDQGDYLARAAILRGIPSEDAVRAFCAEAERAGHGVGTRSGLEASIIAQLGSPEERLAWLERLKVLDQAVTVRGMIGFRYATAVICDAVAAADVPRLRSLAQELAARPQVAFSASWIPVECFMAALGAPVATVDTPWLEPYDVVLARWAEHLSAYSRRHHGLEVSARVLG